MVQLANWQSLARLARLGPKNSNSGANFKAFARFPGNLAHINGQSIPHEGVCHALGDEPGVLVGGVRLGYQVERGYLLFALAVVELVDVGGVAQRGQVFAGHEPLDVVARLVGDGLEGEFRELHGVAGLDALCGVGLVLGLVVELEGIERPGPLDERPEGEVRVGEGLRVELQVAQVHRAVLLGLETVVEAADGPDGISLRIDNPVGGARGSLTFHVLAVAVHFVVDHEGVALLEVGEPHVVVLAQVVLGVVVRGPYNRERIAGVHDGVGLCEVFALVQPAEAGGGLEGGKRPVKEAHDVARVQRERPLGGIVGDEQCIERVGGGGVHLVVLVDEFVLVDAVALHGEVHAEARFDLEGDVDFFRGLADDENATNGVAQVDVDAGGISGVVVVTGIDIHLDTQVRRGVELRGEVEVVEVVVERDKAVKEHVGARTRTHVVAVDGILLLRTVHGQKRAEVTVLFATDTDGVVLHAAGRSGHAYAGALREVPEKERNRRLGAVDTNDIFVADLLDVGRILGFFACRILFAFDCDCIPGRKLHVEVHRVARGERVAVVDV